MSARFAAVAATGLTVVAAWGAVGAELPSLEDLFASLEKKQGEMKEAVLAARDALAHPIEVLREIAADEPTGFSSLLAKMLVFRARMAIRAALEEKLEVAKVVERLAAEISRALLLSRVKLSGALGRIRKPVEFYGVFRALREGYEERFKRAREVVKGAVKHNAAAMKAHSLSERPRLREAFQGFGRWAKTAGFDAVRELLIIAEAGVDTGYF